MAILIDMEMPETCDECDFHIYHSNGEYVCVATPLLYPWNLANYKGGRKDFCPLMASALNTICGNVRNFPTIKPERKIGHWVALDDDYPEDYECDACGFVSEASFGVGGGDSNLYNFCPNCGADMRGDQDE